MEGRKFDPSKLERLNDPSRLETLRPTVLLDTAGMPDARIAVDIGAGTGLLAVAFARLSPGLRVYAADVAPEMLAFMRAHLPADVAERVTPLPVTETHLPLPDGLAEVVTMIAVYHELDDPAASLAEARRVLRAGGRILIVDWCKGCGAAQGPPEDRRVATSEILSGLSRAGFVDVAEHDVLDGFSVVTGTVPAS